MFYMLQIEVTLKESTPEGEIVKEFLHNHGKETIREQLGMYVSLLKEGEVFWTKLLTFLRTLSLSIIQYHYGSLQSNILGKLYVDASVESTFERNWLQYNLIEVRTIVSGSLPYTSCSYGSELIQCTTKQLK